MRKKPKERLHTFKLISKVKNYIFLNLEGSKIFFQNRDSCIEFFKNFTAI